MLLTEYLKTFLLKSIFAKKETNEGKREVEGEKCLLEQQKCKKAPK